VGLVWTLEGAVGPRQPCHNGFERVPDAALVAARNILPVRDQNTLAPLRKKRLMTLAQLFLIHRYNDSSVHYVTPTEDKQFQAQKMKSLGIFSNVNTEIGQIIVAHVSRERVAELLTPDRVLLGDDTEDCRRHSKSRVKGMFAGYRPLERELAGWVA
jgi:hypothetical protein